MTVLVDDNSWYGFGTKHIRVYHPSTVAVHEVPGGRRTNQESDFTSCPTDLQNGSKRGRDRTFFIHPAGATASHEANSPQAIP